MSKKFMKLASCAMSLLMSASLINPIAARADEGSQAQLLSADSEVLQLKEAKARVSVHDPSIVKDGSNYYVFGSHIEAAKSTDLKNWTKFTNSYTTPGNVIFGDLSKNLANSFAWAGENDSDCKGGYSVWAPFVFWNDNYVNADGSKGTYMMYYCTSSTYKRSCIGYAISKNIEGPYTYVDTIVYSGFTKSDAYDANSTINTKYTNTNIQKLIDDKILAGPRSGWFNSDGNYNTSYAPNAIDPALYYDNEGKLWMAYGSWSGGIFALQIDKSTGKAIYPGNDSTTSDKRPIDRYFGTKIAGGYGRSGEGPFVVYDKSSGYYYLYVTYGGLAANGGYNMRMFRATSPQGPFLDASGKNAALPGVVDNIDYGIKLIGNYQFDCLSTGYKAGGHNSSFIDDDGQMYLIYHTRFNSGTEYHEVRVHQMFTNEDGWPVVVPYEFNGDTISQTGYTIDDVVGTYEFINHGKNNDGAMLPTLKVDLKKDYSITGDVTGTWNMKDGSYYMEITYNGVTYKGVFFKQNDESKFDSKVITFSAVGTNNECIWGSKYVDDAKAVAITSINLDSKVPKSTNTDLNLPIVGNYSTDIQWTSSNPSVIDKTGIVNRLDKDVDVTLTAKISKGSEEVTKTYIVTVKAKKYAVNATPIYKYDFNSLKGSTEILNSGTKDGNANLMGSAAVVQDAKRGNVLKLTNKDKAVKANYLALPKDTFDGITNAGYTIGMWVNVDTSNPSYWEHSALFEANAGGQNAYPMTRFSGNLWSRINANGAWSDSTMISKGLKANTWQYVTYTVAPTGIKVYLNGVMIGKDDKNLAPCFAENFLAKMTDVRVGSGNIWGDEDIASAEFDDVAVYNTALTEDQIDALYNTENLSKVTDKVVVNYSVESQWDNHFKANVKVTNNSSETISNWAYKFDMKGSIDNSWNAKIISHIGDTYLIKNTGWPIDIEPGQTVEFGFTASYEGTMIPNPKNFVEASSVERVNESDYDINFHKNNKWKEGFNAAFMVKNLSKTSLEDWTVEFDYKDNIKSISGAKIISHVGNHYVIKCENYNAILDGKNLIKIDFVGEPAVGDRSSEVPANYVLKQVTVK